MAATDTLKQKQPELYVLGRDSTESQRLNSQHEFITAVCDGRLILPSVPKESILNVADIACGTGIWLKDVASELSVTPTSNGRKRHFHGFDISNAQFPAEHPENMKFSIHDVMQPFPEEEKGKYDIVQVRLLVLALKEVDISTAVKHIVQLLRPGGYLQWIDTESELGMKSSTDFITSYELLIRFVQEQGISIRFCSVVKESCETLGMENIEFRDLAPQQKVHLHKRVQAEYLRVMQAAIPRILLKSGKAKTIEEANEIFATGIEKEMEEKSRKGEVPAYPLVLVLARMPA